MLEFTITNEDISKLEAEYSEELYFNECRRNAIKHFNDIQACAGSGKTTLLAMKLIILAKKWKNPYAGICVLTHTNAAKKEIIDRLQAHPTGYKLLLYPHFIGTIQEFINKFLGLPYLRSFYEFKRFSENSEANKEVLIIDGTKNSLNNLCKNLYRAVNRLQYNDIKWALGSLHYMNSDFDLRFFYGPHGGQIVSKNGDSARYQLLKKLKQKLCSTGIFQYMDMYAFAERNLIENPDLVLTLQFRFPIIFIDEMQDTQKFQDDLLRMIFSSDNVIIQCFGDPDQSIFDGIGGEKPNESYNQAELDSIDESHRFGNDIAEIIRGFSFNGLKIKSIRKELEGSGPHSILIFNDETIINVMPTYGEITHEYFSKDEALAKNYRDGKYVVKAIGAIGTENSNGLTIKHYWSEYDKRKNPKSFRAQKLIHIVKNCSLKKSGSTSDDYDEVVKGILDLLFKAGKKTTNSNGNKVYFTKTSLHQSLELSKKISDFRKLVTSWIICDFPNGTTWDQQKNILCESLNMDFAGLPDEAKEYLDYDASNQVAPTNPKSSMNIYNFNDVLDIQVGTIHSVKGETHDATLILETKFNKYFDLKDSLDYLINEGKSRPIEDHESPTSKASIHAKFLKQLYVATTRARHLVCLAIHEDHITDEQEQQLIEKGWKVQSV